MEPGQIRDRDVPLRWKRLLPLAAAAPLSLLLIAGGLVFPGAVESAYSRGAYPLFAGMVSSVTAHMPFALSEVLLAGAALFALAKIVSAAVDVARKRRRFSNAAARALAVSAAAGCACWGAFILAFGLNHFRVPLSESAGMDVSPPSAEEIERLAKMLAQGAGRLRTRVGERPDGVFRLKDPPRIVIRRAQDGFRAARGEPGLPQSMLTTVPKAAALSPLMSALSIGGYYFPFTAEPVVNVDAPHCTLLHAACHEIAHFSGFAAEDEANFAGYLACRNHPDDEFRYSGEFTALVYALGALRKANPGAHALVAKGLDAGVARDMKDLAEFWRRRENPAARAAQGVNHAYLRAHGKVDGIESYGRFVDLMVARSRR